MAGNQPKREINLLEYYPEFLRELREFKHLTKAEETELRRLCEKFENLWQDGFIQSASLQGIKRWESLLGIRPYSGDRVEERRSAVLMKWNQQLPYTLPRLVERLDTVVGAGAYELDVRYGQYELELQLINQTYRTLREAREMTRQMIPANLMFIFAGRYPARLQVELMAGSRLGMTTDFYARYNREFLYLDGSWELDGAYLLNGYKEIEELDMYPARMSARSEWQVPVRWAVAGGCMAGAEVVPEAESNLRIAGAATGQPAGETRLGLSWLQPAAPDVDCQLRVEHNLWYLDGAALLDGARFLDAEIFEYDL